MVASTIIKINYKTKFHFQYYRNLYFNFSVLDLHEKKLA